MKQQIGIFQNEMDKLRSDNIKLYEKIKFVQNYPVRILSAENGFWICVSLTDYTRRG